MISPSREITIGILEPGIQLLSMTADIRESHIGRARHGISSREQLVLPSNIAG